MPKKSARTITKGFTDLNLLAFYHEGMYQAIDDAIKNGIITREAVENKNPPAIAAMYLSKDTRRKDYIDVCDAKGLNVRPGVYAMPQKSYKACCSILNISTEKYKIDIFKDYIFNFEPNFGVLKAHEPVEDDTLKRILDEIILTRKACQMMVRKQCETNQKLLDIIGDQNALHGTTKEILGAYNGIGGHVGGDVGTIQRDVRDLGRLLSDKLGKVKA